ncbi:MAG: hypothetical protein ABIK84_05865, partial [candidate division WOR-3 bacterium]
MSPILLFWFLLLSKSGPLDSLNVRLLGKWGFGEGYMCDELISDSITYVASGSGLFIFDIRNPSSIEKIGELN